MEVRYTRVPHDPEYTALLGAAVYAFAYVEWLLVELVLRLRPDLDHVLLAPMTSGEVATILRSALSGLPPDEERGVADRFGALVTTRNDIIHTHPATAEDGVQRLHRWAPHKGRIGFVSDALLRQFISDVEALNQDGNSLRDYIRARPAPPTPQG